MPDVSLGLAGPFSHGRVITELHAPDDPAAATVYTYTVDGAYWERPVSLSFLFATDDTDGDRLVQLQYFDGSGIAVAQSYVQAAQEASTEVYYTFLPNISQPVAAFDQTALAPLPVMFLQPTWTLVIQPGIAGAGDQVSQIRYYREKYITGPGGYEIGVQEYENGNEYLLQRIADALS